VRNKIISNPGENLLPTIFMARFRLI